MHNNLLRNHRNRPLPSGSITKFYCVQGKPTRPTVTFPGITLSSMNPFGCGDGRQTEVNTIWTRQVRRSVKGLPLELSNSTTIAIAINSNWIVVIWTWSMTNWTGGWCHNDCGWVIEVANMYLCLDVVAGNPSCSTGWLIQTSEHRNQGCLAGTWDTRKNTLAVPFVK